MEKALCSEFCEASGPFNVAVLVKERPEQCFCPKNHIWQRDLFWTKSSTLNWCRLPSHLKLRRLKYCNGLTRQVHHPYLQCTCWQDNVESNISGLMGIFKRCENSLRHDPQWEWNEVLSPGEVQKLVLLRLLFHKPQVAFLDEVTSAMSTEDEATLMRLCESRLITLISIGHRDSLKKYHSLVLRLGLPNASWDLSEDTNSKIIPK